MESINIDLFPVLNETKVHIRAINRTTRKYKTIIENLSEALTEKIDLKIILKTFKIKYCCNGNISEEDGKKVIILQGDHRKNIFEFLVKNNYVKKENIMIHGS